MEVISSLHDGRINSTNYMVEMPIEEYLGISRDILKQNEFQRRRVSSSKTIYSLLKQDVLKGCVIPPVVLALTSVAVQQSIKKEEVSSFVLSHKNDLVILDGLQRTYSLVDLEAELIAKGDQDNLKMFYGQRLRVEVYVGINRLGILYRMLTLNTGQTPMSLRQQIEILYLDYTKAPVGDVVLVREADNRPIADIKEYNFRETLEGFNSYLERNELPIERTDLLENITSLEKLSEENQEQDIYRDFLASWHDFIVKINTLTNAEEFSADHLNEYVKEFGNPFGRNVVQIFKRSQAITGFGAAIGRLKDFNLISGFEAIQEASGRLNISIPPQEYLMRINSTISWITGNSKRIGNAQRMYFQYYFREIFNPDGDCYCKPDKAIDVALQRYKSQNL